MKLKPCPFCQGGGRLVSDGWEPGNNYIICNKCESRGPIKDTERKAVNAWNRRGDKKKSVFILLDGKKFGEDYIVGVTDKLKEAIDWQDLELAREYIEWRVE